MKVALIRGRWHSVWEPLALGYLYSYTKDLPNVDYIYMGDGAFDSDEEIIKHCAEADIVGFSGTTSQMPWSLRIASAIRLRSPDVRIYIGGYGPSVDPGSFVEKVHGVVVGEGETPWKEILESGGMESGVIYRPPVSNLDSIPFPNREFIRVERCIDVAKREEGRRVTGILGNRGCLRRCVFCADGLPKSIYGVKLRERSPKNCVDEMIQVSDEWNIDFLKWADAEFNTRPGRTKEMCAEMVARELKINWGANFLANPWEDGDGALLYRAGCREAWIGLESGSLAIHRTIGKGVTPNLIAHALKDARDGGLVRRCYVLLGMPDETLETIAETEALIDSSEPDFVSFSILASYPGTNFYRPEMASWDWEHIDEYGGDANQFHNLGITKMNREQLLNERIRLMEKYAGKLPAIVKKKRDLGWIGYAPNKVISTDEIQITDYSDRCG